MVDVLSSTHMHQHSPQLVDLMDQPPDPALYTPLAQHHNEVLLLGTNVNNMYDHLRINLNPELNPIRVRVPVGSKQWKMFHGVQLQPSQKYHQVKRVLTSTPPDHPQSKHMYRNRVQFCGLSCDECWALFDDKIFPLDASNLPHVSLNRPYMKLMQQICTHTTEHTPWYTQHTQPKIFILCHR